MMTVKKKRVLTLYTVNTLFTRKGAAMMDYILPIGLILVLAVFIVFYLKKGK